jgi:hypothetical protein
MRTANLQRVLKASVHDTRQSKLNVSASILVIRPFPAMDVFYSAFPRNLQKIRKSEITDRQVANQAALCTSRTFTLFVSRCF